MRWTELLAAALLLLAPTACALGRTYVGSEIIVEPAEHIRPGRTTRNEVLQVFGPPDRILRHVTGDVFMYRFQQKNQSELTIEEPVVTNMDIFTWNKVQEKDDRLTIFFDPEGVVTSFGYRRGTEELDRF